MHVKPLLTLFALAAALLSLDAQAARALQPEDWYRFQALSDLQIAPDGSAIAYLVTSYDKESDQSRSALWSSAWTSGEAVQLTRGESVTDPRFSPDGRYLSFLAARPATGATQLWLLDRRGGEARQVSRVERGDLRLRMVARRRCTWCWSCARPPKRARARPRP